VLRDLNGNPAMFLLKIGRQEHMEQFRRGLLYMNPLNHWRRVAALAQVSGH
jgi:hypothetical protein